MKSSLVLLALLSASILIAQDQTETTPPPPAPGDEIYDELAPATPPSRGLVKLQDFETIVVASLREEFPRLSGIFTSVHACRLPDYGPVVSIALQLPAFYFTRPVLQELERRQKIAEQQALRVRSEIERAAQTIRLKAREAELVDQMDMAYGSKKKTKVVLIGLQKELEDVRKSIKELDTPVENVSEAVPDVERVQEVDLEKMILASHQQLIGRITVAIKDILAEKAPSLADVKASERISITAHVRDSFMSNRERSIIFVLNGTDIEAYRKGDLDLAALKNKVLVKLEED
jgi:hypothetical protein